MSLDIHQLTAHLSRERRIEVLRAYRQQAKHDTTAFLFCFFLGTIGAHRLYLRQWGAAVPRLVLGALFLVGLAVGIVAQIPISVLAVVLAVLFIIMLAWEIADLYGIDAEVDQANRALAQRLLAAQPATADSARPTAPAASASDGIGVITVSDIAGALALADEVGMGRLRESTSTPGGPDTSPAPTAPAARATPSPGDLTDAHPWPGSTHPIADPETTQGPVYVELSTTPTPGVPPAVVASGGPDHTDAHAPQAHPIADVEAVGATGLAGAIYVALPQQAPPSPPTPSAPVDATDQHTQVQRTHPIADVEGAARGPVVVDLAAGAPALAVTAGPDLTDVHLHAPQARTVGDIEAGGRGSVYVNLPESLAPSGDDALVMFVPSEEAPTSATPAPEGSPWGGMMSPAASAPAAEGAPVWPVAPAETAAPPVWPVAPPEQPNTESERQPETLAELAALGGAAGLAGAAEHATRMHDAPPGVASEPTLPLPPRDTPAVPSVPLVTPEPAAPPTPTATPMKRVRVVRRIVLEDGGVVRELVAERIVPMDTDSQAIAAELEAELAHATPEEIAELAHLPSDTPIVVRSRVESGPLSGKLKPPDGQTPPTQGDN